MSKQLRSLYIAMDLTLKAIEGHMASGKPLGSDDFQALLWGRREIQHQIKELTR